MTSHNTSYLSSTVEVACPRYLGPHLEWAKERWMAKERSSNAPKSHWSPIETHEKQREVLEVRRDALTGVGHAFIGDEEAMKGDNKA